MDDSDSISASERVVSMGELLEVIFEYAACSTKARCARVCKFWSNVSLDNLWKSMQSMEPVFSLLSPMEDDTTMLQARHGRRELKFARKVQAKDWVRFNTYAPRIKHLRLTESTRGGYTHTSYSSSVLLEVAHKRRTLSLLPVLVDLEVSASLDKSLLDYTTLLVGESLRHLSIYVPHDEAFMESFFEEMAERVSNLDELRLWFTDEPEESVDSLLAFLGVQKDLRVVGFSSNALSPDIIITLGSLPLLEEVVNLDDGDGIKRETVAWHPLKLAEGSFPNLTTLELVLELEEAYSLLLEGSPPPSVTSLSIRTSQIETADAVRQFFSAVSHVYPKLLKLTLDEVFKSVTLPMLGDIFFDAEGHKLGLDRVTVDDFEPLMDLSLLTTFVFSYHRTLFITDSDVDRLVSGWPHLAELVLSHQPTILRERPLLTLHALPIIASHCPQLRRISLYVVLSGPVPLPVSPTICFGEDSPGQMRSRFEHLEHIEFGLSQTSGSPVAVAEFLSSLGADFVPSSKLSWRFWAAEDRLLKGYKKRLSAATRFWSEVESLLPVMRNMREHERRRLEMAKREIDSLRTRNRALEEHISQCAGAK